MKYSVTIDVPDLDEGIRFYREALGFAETGRPFERYAVLRCDRSEIGLMERAAGTRPAKACDDLRRYARHWTPVHVDFEVEDFEAALANILAAGAKCEQKFAGGEHPPIAFCADPFGNGFCLVGASPSG